VIIVEIIDILFLSGFAILFLILIILVITKKFDMFAFMIISLFLCGLVLIWGIASIGRPELQLLPVWIQAGASLILIIITGFYTYATFQIVKANQALVELNQFDRESKVIKDMAQNIYLPIIGRLESEKDFFERGWNIGKFLYEQQMKPEDRLIVRDSPNDYLKKQIHLPDSILIKYLPEIKELSNEFDGYDNRLREINVKVFERKDVVWGTFKELCDKLNLSETKFPNKDDYDSIFVLTIADARTTNKVLMYQFFNENREALRSKLISSKLRECIEEYAQLREDFMNYCPKFEKKLHELLNEWQRKYYLIDSELQDPFNTYV
jgi:hypothetical protein